MLTIETARKSLTRLMRSLIFATASATFIGASGCGSGSPTTAPNGGKVTGTYTLEYVEDEELPVAIHRGAWLDPATGIFYNNFVVELTNGYIELRENETFYMALQVRIQADGQEAVTMVEFEGEWDEVKDQVLLRIPGAGMQVFDRDGSWLTTDIDLVGTGESVELDFKR
jgi:hypothetical protein